MTQVCSVLITSVIMEMYTPECKPETQEKCIRLDFLTPVD